MRSTSKIFRNKRSQLIESNQTVSYKQRYINNTENVVQYIYMEGAPNGRMNEAPSEKLGYITEMSAQVCFFQLHTAISQLSCQGIYEFINNFILKFLQLTKTSTFLASPTFIILVRTQFTKEPDMRVLYFNISTCVNTSIYNSKLEIYHGYR